MDEIDLAKRAKKHDTQAFLLLMDLYKETLYRTAFSFLKNEHDAIEALQEVTVRAYKKIHTVKEPKYMKTWLVRIMMNYCQDQLKYKQRFTVSQELHEIGAELNFTHLEIEEALSKLPDAGQRLIHLKYFQDVKNKDIAVSENIPEGTVKSRLHHALKALRKYLSEEGGSDHV